MGMAAWVSTRAGYQRSWRLTRDEVLHGQYATPLAHRRTCLLIHKYVRTWPYHFPFNFLLSYRCSCKLVSGRAHMASAANITGWYLIRLWLAYWLHVLHSHWGALWPAEDWLQIYSVFTVHSPIYTGSYISSSRFQFTGGLYQHLVALTPNWWAEDSTACLQTLACTCIEPTYVGT